jgi:hypothetical protein
MDARRHDRRTVRHVITICEKELKSMLAGREGKSCLRLAAAEVEMAEVVWNGLVERRQFGVDQQMMVS